MNAFPILALFTIAISYVVLRTSFDDLRETPRTLDLRAAREREADEGLLDTDLASADPIRAWLDRYLTPPTN